MKTDQKLPALRVNRAFTVLEMMVVMVVMAVAIFLVIAPALTSDGRHGPLAVRIYCVNNLKQTGLAFRIWSGDNGGKYPMATFTNRAGAVEYVGGSNLFR